MANIETSIKWFYDRQGLVTYSMTSRLGPNSYDCSSAVYLSLIDGGFFPSNQRIGNTDSLFGDLERAGWTQVPIDGNGNAATQRGDVFIWGKRGASGGAAGHTGMFIDGDNIIHCSYGYNGIHIDNHDLLWQYNGQPPYTFYRYTGAPAPDTGIKVGDSVRFAGTYTAEDVQTVYDIRQIRTTELYKSNFDWGDNGVPVSYAVKVDKDGYRIDTPITVGDRYVIPNSFSVLDVMVDGDTDYALLAGIEVWFAIDSLTEDGKSTPVPSYKPSTTPEDPEPTPEPVPQPPIEEPKPPINPPKEDDMAYSKDDIKELRVATERIQDVVDDVAASEEVQKITQAIPQKVKIAVYFIGDALILIGILVPQIAVAANAGLPVEQVTALSSVFATAGASLLTFFGIYKSGKK